MTESATLMLVGEGYSRSSNRVPVENRDISPVSRTQYIFFRRKPQRQDDQDIQVERGFGVITHAPIGTADSWAVQ